MKSEDYKFVHHLTIETGKNYNFDNIILDDLECPYCGLIKGEDKNNKKIIVWRIGCYQCEVHFTNSRGINKLFKRSGSEIIEFSTLQFNIFPILLLYKLLSSFSVFCLP